MTRTRRNLLTRLPISLALALVGCGGGYSGFIIPQETELKPWTAPTEDEILERAVFLDRDGTINVEKEYLHLIEDMYAGAREA